MVGLEGLARQESVGHLVERVAPAPLVPVEQAGQQVAQVEQVAVDRLEPLAAVAARVNRVELEHPE